MRAAAFVLADVTIPGEALAGVIAIILTVLTGLGAWTLTKVVRLSENVATLTATVAQLERATADLFARMHTVETK